MKKALTLVLGAGGQSGVRGRNSDNKLFRENIGWAPDYPLAKGMATTFEWINSQIKNSK